MSKKKKIFLSVISVCLAFLIFICGYFVAERAYTDKELRRVKFILDTYHKYYYDEGGDYLSDMTKGLMDKNCDFFTKKEYEEYSSSTSGSRKNAGFAVNRETLEVVRIAYNSPADRAGMTTGGKIVKVNGQSVSNSQELNEKCVEGENVYTVLYDSGERDFTVTSSNYTETFVRFCDGENEYSFKGEKNIELCSSSENLPSIPDGYSYLVYRSFVGFDINSTGWKSDFSSSVGQFVKALELFKSGTNRKIIIDLRDNGGGYVEAMRYLVSFFIGEEDGEKLVVQKNCYKNKTERLLSYPTKSQEYNFEKIVILANSSSASASEAFIGALLDYDASDKVSVIVEKNYSRGDYSTYGKGTMQSTYSSSSGDVVKLTVAQVRFPLSETCIDSVGITTAVSSKVIEAKTAENQPIDALLYAKNNF